MSTISRPPTYRVNTSGHWNQIGPLPAGRRVDHRDIKQGDASAPTSQAPMCRAIGLRAADRSEIGPYGGGGA